MKKIIPSALFYSKASYAYDPVFDQQEFRLFPYSEYTYSSSTTQAGARVSHQPIHEINRKSKGAIVPFFFADYYNRVHINPRVLNLGNILNTQTRKVEIWNAYTHSQALNKISARSAEGVVFDLSPTLFNALESRIYDVTISEQGGANLDATFTLEFDDITLDLRILGNRVTLFSFVPKMRFTETYEWLTDVIKTLATEQRILLRATPRRTLDYDFVFNALQFSKFKTMINQWINRLFAIPLWYDKTRLDFLAEYATFIRLDTSNLEYENGGSVLIYESEDKYEVIEIESVTDQQLSLKLPIAQNYQRPYVMPVKFGYINDNNANRTQNNIIEASTQFLITDQSDLPAPSLSQYLGYDVLLDCPQINQSEVMSKSSEIIDNELSHILKFDNEDITRLSQTLSFFKKTREEVFAFKKWLYSRRGRQKAFWLPSFNNDLQLTQIITSTATTMIVKNTNFYLYGDKTHFVLKTKSGNHYFAEIQSAQNNQDGTETIFFDQAFNVEITVDDVKSISFMNLVRLDSDRIEIEHLDFEMCRINFPVINIKE